MIKFFVAIGVALVSVLAVMGDKSRAAGNRTAGGFDPMLDEFWGRWEGVKPSEAIIRAAPTPELQRAWDDIARRADDYQSRAGGRCLGHSEITQKSLGENVEYVSYFAHYDPTPLRVQILCYRSKDTWRLINLRIDDEPSRWMEEVSGQVEVAPTTITVPAN